MSDSNEVPHRESMLEEAPSTQLLWARSDKWGKGNSLISTRLVHMALNYQHLINLMDLIVCYEALMLFGIFCRSLPYIDRVHCSKIPRHRFPIFRYFLISPCFLVPSACFLLPLCSLITLVSYCLLPSFPITFC